MGGGTALDLTAANTAEGLSPRGRGNQAHLDFSLEQASGVTVYPRVGGGTFLVSVNVCPIGGLSPRGRGNHGVTTLSRRGVGSIPAWAGEPVTTLLIIVLEAVYPRVGGGTAHPFNQGWILQGLSPRGRGNLLHLVPQARPLRSIPAWAGEPAIPALGNRVYAVYPRVGGGTLGTCS